MFRPARDGRLTRATYALMVSILPATATIVGVVILSQVPTWIEGAGVALVVSAVALHREAVSTPSDTVSHGVQGADVPSRP